MAAAPIAPLKRIRALAKSDSDVQKESLDLEAGLRAGAEESVDLLASVPLSLIRLELAQCDADVDRLVAGLRESNRRMKDLAEAYDEVRLTSQIGTLAPKDEITRRGAVTAPLPPWLGPKAKYCIGSTKPNSVALDCPTRWS